LYCLGSLLTNNQIAGIRHDPVISSKQQQEIAGWFRLAAADYNPAVTYLPIMLPRADEHTVIDFSNEGETKYLITERLSNSQLINKIYLIKVGTLSGTRGRLTFFFRDAALNER
jgi:hypothetical protein